MSKEGVSVIQVAVAIAVAGIIAMMATPVVDSSVARARRSEATFNLQHITSLQKSYFELENKFSALPLIGYNGNGNHKCDDLSNTLGFNFSSKKECETLRYNYKTEPVGNDTSYQRNYQAIAYAPSDHKDYYIYPGCDGTGSSGTGKNSGDLLKVWHMSGAQVCRNILDFCPQPPSASVSDGCANLASFVPISSPHSSPSPPSNPAPPANPAPPTNCTSCSSVCSTWSAWGSWGSWSACSNGSQTRTRIRSRTCAGCSNCSVSDTDTDTRTCSSSCSSTCGNWGNWSYGVVAPKKRTVLTSSL